MLILAKLYFRIKEIQSSSDKQKLETFVFITTSLALQEKLKGVLQTEIKGHQLVTWKHMKV